MSRSFEHRGGFGRGENGRKPERIEEGDGRSEGLIIGKEMGIAGGGYSLGRHVEEETT